MHRDTIVGEFTHQADTFNRSAVANAPDLLQALVELADAAADERWLDVACGPGAVARALAPHARAVHGVDATPAMLDVARREAHAHGLTNLTFSDGDATALAWEPGSWDGAVSRFALHHIPVPERVVHEMARVVAPGGRVVLADSVADPDLSAYAWSQEIERLRDPSHWASVSAAALRVWAAAAGLTLEREVDVMLAIDFEDWLARGSGHVNAALIDRALAAAPANASCFSVRPGPTGRILDYRVCLTSWRRD
jgi:SAM-dependent methyltransferase